MRYLIRHVFIFIFILELGMLAMIFKPVQEARADTRIVSALAKSVSATGSTITVTRFPTSEERYARSQSLMEDLSDGAKAVGLSEAVSDVSAYLRDQMSAMIVSAPAPSR